MTPDYQPRRNAASVKVHSAGMLKAGRMAVISVQASPCDAASWLDLARRCESAGFDALLAADPPGSGPSPFVALAAAAAVTSRIGLGSYVSNAAVRDPILLAADVATL